MKVLVCGDRNWTDRAAIEDRLSRLAAGSVVIHGAQRTRNPDGPDYGADYLAGEAAASLGLPVIAVPAEWKKFGRSAGPIRNRKMLDMGPGLVIAFHPNLSKSKGTADMVGRARRAGVPVEVIAGGA